MAELGAERRGSGHGGIDVKPYFIFDTDAANFRQRINRIRGGCTNRGANKARNETRGTVLLNSPYQRIRTHGEVLIDINEPQVIETEPRDLNIFFNRRVRLRRCIRHQLSVATPLVADEVGGAFASGEQSAKRRA